MALNLTQYDYVAASDIAPRTLHVGQLMREIEESSLHPTKYLNRVWYNDLTLTVEITFEQPLDVAEKLVLDQVIAAHDASDDDGEYLWILRDEKATGTHGGTALAQSWQTRVLNTVDVNSSSSGACTISSNQIVLETGRYEFHAEAPAYGVHTHIARLYNVTQQIVVNSGLPSHSVQIDQTKGYTSSQTISTIECVFNVQNGPETFAVEHWCCNVQTTNGLGRAIGIAGLPEVYTGVRIKQLS